LVPVKGGKSNFRHSKKKKIRTLRMEKRVEDHGGDTKGKLKGKRVLYRRCDKNLVVMIKEKKKANKRGDDSWASEGKKKHPINRIRGGEDLGINDQK